MTDALKRKTTFEYHLYELDLNIAINCMLWRDIAALDESELIQTWYIWNSN